VTNWSGCDPGAPRSYPGWSGVWKGTMTGGKRGCGITDVLEGSFVITGGLFPMFHTGTGTGGRKFDISGCIFLDDFPKLKKKFKKYCRLYNTRQTAGKREHEIIAKAAARFRKTKKYKSMTEELEAAHDEVSRLEYALDMTAQEAIDKVLEKHKSELLSDDWCTTTGFAVLSSEFNEYIPKED